jgi:hypothetical protein
LPAIPEFGLRKEIYTYKVYNTSVSTAMCILLQQKHTKLFGVAGIAVVVNYFSYLCSLRSETFSVLWTPSFETTRDDVTGPIINPKLYAIWNDISISLNYNTYMVKNKTLMHRLQVKKKN